SILCGATAGGFRKFITITARKAKKAIGRATRRTRMVFCMSGGEPKLPTYCMRRLFRRRTRIDDGEPRAGRRVRVGLDVKEQIDRAAVPELAKRAAHRRPHDSIRSPLAIAHHELATIRGELARRDDLELL